MTLPDCELPHAARLRRQHRSAVAHRLLDAAPQAARAVSWGQLDAAPVWLTLSADGLALYTRRIGSVLAAPALRLWIAGPRVAALRAAVGADWHDALLARADWPAMPPQAKDWPDDAQNGDTAALLQRSGAAVLLATLPHGALRHAASQLLAPVALFVMPQAAACEVVERALALQMAMLPAASAGIAGADAAPVPQAAWNERRVVQ